MDKFLSITPGEIPTKSLHQYLLGSVSPRPIALASTIGPDGVANLAPFSFFNVFSANPPILIFSPARRVRDNTTKHTLDNIYSTPETVVNIVSYAMVQQMNLSSAEYPEGVNEFKKAGFTEIASELIKPPRVMEAPVQMECKVIEIKPLASRKGAGQLVIAEVLRMHINREVLGADEMIDPHKIDAVARMGKMFYSRASGDAIFTVNKPGNIPGIGIDQLPESIRLSSILTGNDLGKLGNAETLPSAEAIQAFRNTEKDLLARLGNGESIHEKAKEFLASGQNEKALALLMAGIA